MGCGLRGRCPSSKPNEVLGTFAMYYGEPRKPTPRDVALVEAAAHLALIAIESDRTQAALKQALNDIQRAQAKLREDERELRRIVTQSRRPSSC